MHRSTHPYLTPVQLAERWQISASILANWRYLGKGPAYVKIGHLVRYPLEGVVAFEAEQEVA